MNITTDLATSTRANASTISALQHAITDINTSITMYPAQGEVYAEHALADLRVARGELVPTTPAAEQVRTAVRLATEVVDSLHNKAWVWYERDRATFRTAAEHARRALEELERTPTRSAGFIGSGELEGGHI